jgi:ATP-dependent exoDNAse (exonuclease V) beta subunit
MAADKKGITVKVDADLHAEIREYLDAHQMTMAEFISLAVEDELHPKYQEKEENTMEKMRTLAFQVPEDLFQRIKDYLHRNNMTQKEFVIGLIENEIDRDLTERETQDNTEEEAVEDDVYDGEELEDDYDEDEDVLVMMTIHSAKGLEFPIVYLTGMEEGLFPSARSMDTAEDLEEERRLCYVAITRAKNQLYLTGAQSRTLYGQTTHQNESRFLGEIPAEYKVEDGMSKADIFGATVTKIQPAVNRAKTEIFRGFSNASSAPAAEINFAPGERIRHKKFGEGTIRAVQKFEKDAMVEILFDSGETKRLMAAFAKLEKI